MLITYNEHTTTITDEQLKCEYSNVFDIFFNGVGMVTYLKHNGEVFVSSILSIVDGELSTISYNQLEKKEKIIK